MAEPRIRFVIGGVQKGGTTALARYLAGEPDIALPDRLPDHSASPQGFSEAWVKEAHVFDAPAFDDAWTTEDIDRRYAPHFSRFDAPAMLGDATPVYLLHPQVVRRIARYNPAMKWIIVLREPVDRAISHYFMERRRGVETLSLARAVLAERRRIAGSWADFRADAPWRTFSYAARSCYRHQLSTLGAEFPVAQVLLLRSDDVAHQPAAVIAQVRQFLGLPPAQGAVHSRRVFEGGYEAPPSWSPGRLLLRWRLRKDVREFGRCCRHIGDAG